MGIGTKLGGFGAFATFGLLSGSIFYNYAHQPVIQDVKLITQSAETLGETIDFMDKFGDGYLTSENSTLPLTYALERMAIVQQDNPDKTEDIGKLVSQLEKVKASQEIMADPLLYRTALSGLKTDLSGYATTTRSGDDLLFGVIFALPSLFGVCMIIFDE